jgi:hypothetical protein
MNMSRCRGTFARLVAAAVTGGRSAAVDSGSYNRGDACSTPARLHYCRSKKLQGGVVEWLMAPVLKTGRPKGLVGSNPTPSAICISDFRLSISERGKKPLRSEESAHYSENRSEGDVRKIMRTEIYARRGDQ